MDLVGAVFQRFHAFHGRIKMEIDFILQKAIQVFQHHIVDVGAQMAHRGIQQMQIVLNAGGFKAGACRGIQLGTLPAVAQIDLVYIVHQLQRLLFADIFIQRAAEIVGDVIFAVRKRTGAAKAAHDRAGFAADAAFYLVAVNGAAALAEGMTGFKHAHLQLRGALGKLKSGKNAAGACADYNDIILHIRSSRCAIGSVQNESVYPAAAAFEALKKASKALDFSTAEVFFRTPADAFSFHCRSIPAL